MSGLGTRISYVHGVNRIGANEVTGRGAMLRSQEYIPFTQLSQGQFDLMVDLNLARTYADYSGDTRYIQAENLINRALKGDTSLSGIGAIDPMLYDVARRIKQATRHVYPVIGNPFSSLSDCQMYAGMQILKKYDADLKLMYGDRHKSRYELVKTRLDYRNIVNDVKSPTYNENNGAKFKLKELLETRVGQYYTPQDGPLIKECNDLKQIETAYNTHLKNTVHHAMYDAIDMAKWSNAPTKVEIKAFAHGAGINGLADAATLNQNSFRNWAQSLLVTKNIESEVGAVQPLETAFAFDKTDKYYSDYKARVKKAKGDKTAGIKALTDKQFERLLKIIGAATGAFTSIYTVISAQRRESALARAQNIGSDVYNAKPNDWLGDTSGGSSSGSALNTETMLLIGGGLAAAYFLTQD